jgi:mRNA interferase RelE/StbE
MGRVHLTQEAADDVRDLDGSPRGLVLKALKKLETDPELRGQPLGSNIGGNLSTFRKLVVGNRDYRIVYRCIENNEAAVVMVVAKRADNEVYDLAVARLQLHEDPKMRELANNLRGLMP